MDLSLVDTKLSRTLADEKAMKRAYGDRAKRLKLRLDFLAQADSLGEVPCVPPTRCHLLKGDWAGHFAVDIDGNWRLVFRPNHDPIPITVDGGMDLKAITAIVIVAIIDYH